MKRLAILAAVLLAGTAASAQSPAKDRLKEIEELTVKAKKQKSASFAKDLLETEVLSNAGFGIHHVEGDFNNSFGPSRELFINVLELRFNPCSHVSFNAGADFKWDHFTARGNRQFSKDAAGEISLAAPAGGPYDKFKSTLCLTAFTVPATIGLHFGDLSIYGGAELVRHLGKYTHIKDSFEDGDASGATRTEGGNVERYAYDYLAAISYDDLGVYFKYYPRNILPGPKFNYWSIGLVAFF